MFRNNSNHELDFYSDPRRAAGHCSGAPVAARMVMRRGPMGTVPNNCSHLGETYLHSEMLPNKTPLARCAEAETGSGQHNSFLISLPAVQCRGGEERRENEHHQIPTRSSSLLYPTQGCDRLYHQFSPILWER